jgi:ribosomal protein S4
VYVNYKKVLSPSYNVKPGDSISIYINSWKQKYHRINDPLYTHRLMHGLYRKNTGRQSLTAREKQPEFIKTSLNNLSTIHDTITPADKIIMHDILPFSAKDRIKMNNNMRTDNNPNIAN